MDSSDARQLALKMAVDLAKHPGYSGEARGVARQAQEFYDFLMGKWEAKEADRVKRRYDADLVCQGQELAQKQFHGWNALVVAHGSQAVANAEPDPLDAARDIAKGTNNG